MSQSPEREHSEGVTITGPDTGQPIVLVHGTIFNRTMWAPQRDSLSEKYRVIVPDLPGHGTRTDEPFRLDTAIETLAGVIDDVAHDRVHLVGISLGGYVATAYARRRPDTVDTLVLSGSSANPVGLLGTVTRLLGKATLRVSGSDLVERATDWLAERYVRSRDLSPATTDEIVGAGFDLRPFGEAGVEIADVDFRAALASCPGPALVLNGKWDLVMRLGERAHSEANTQTDVQVIDGAGHACNLDQPTAYTAAVDAFVHVAAETVDSD
jgi:pimeloyl-ACP methyl ester carboxylesterase